MKIKEFSQACENNKNPILDVLRKCFVNAKQVLEIGSGSGQHALHFAEQLSWLTWQPTEIAERIPVLRDNCGLSPPENLSVPLVLNIFERWPENKSDAIFSANTLHIVPISGTEAIFSGMATNITPGFRAAIYGPFKYGGKYTSESNAAFDKWLRSQNFQSGIRDFEVVDEMARRAGLSLIEDFKMPANNQLLVWGA